MAGEEIQVQPKLQPIFAVTPMTPAPSATADAATMPPPAVATSGEEAGADTEDGTAGNEGDGNGNKRPAPTDANGAPEAKAAKVIKRRAARACVSCRQRKVRCDVVEGAPCGNCRWDNVECIVQESRRRK